jgi:hypothetical protein
MSEVSGFVDTEPSKAVAPREIDYHADAQRNVEARFTIACRLFDRTLPIIRPCQRPIIGHYVYTLSDTCRHE